MDETIPTTHNVPEGGIDHDAALDLAKLKHGSNLAKCYLDLHNRFEELKLRHDELKELIRSAVPEKGVP